MFTIDNGPLFFESFESHDDDVIEIDGFNKKSGSYILECSNIEHKDETVQVKVTFRIFSE